MSIKVKMLDGTFQTVAGDYALDQIPTHNSVNPVESGGIYTALQGKQDTLTFDTAPTENSNNPVTSGGVYTAIQNAGGGGGGGGGSASDSANIAINATNYSGHWRGNIELTYGADDDPIPDKLRGIFVTSNHDLARFSNLYSDTTTYPYGFWQWITTITNAGNYNNLINNNGERDCIKVGDYIFCFGNLNKSTPQFAMIMGIDTYTGQFSHSTFPQFTLGHHIDWKFITGWGAYKDEDDYDHYINSTATNNGNFDHQGCWNSTNLYFWLNGLSGSTAEGNTVDFTSSTTSPWNTIKTQYMSGAIIPKYIDMGDRSYDIDENNDSFLCDIGNLWCLTEPEIFGLVSYSDHKNPGAGTYVQYPLFAGNKNNVLLYDNTGAAVNQWLSQPATGNHTQWCAINTNGTSVEVEANSHGINTYLPNASYYTYTNMYCTICFRTGTTFTVNPDWS